MPVELCCTHGVLISNRGRDADGEQYSNVRAADLAALALYMLLSEVGSADDPLELSTRYLICLSLFFQRVPAEPVLSTLLRICRKNQTETNQLLSIMLDSMTCITTDTIATTIESLNDERWTVIIGSAKKDPERRLTIERGRHAPKRISCRAPRAHPSVEAFSKPDSDVVICT
jgi:hypothetical protein